MRKSCLFLLTILLTSILQAQQQRPNIIYIMADDLGYADLSCYGRKDYTTPHLDKLASQGLKFMNAYAAAPVCTPTRVAFMTGRYPARLALGLKEPIDWNEKDSIVGLSSATPSIASRLKSAGYETNLIGKWHLGFRPDFGPTKNGFDYFFGFNGGGVDYASHKSPRGGGADLYENEKPVTMDGYMTELIRDKAIAVIKKKRDQPFFLNIMFSAPHWPWQGPGDAAYHDTAKWIGGGSPQIYAAMIKSMDDAVGDIMKALDDAGLAQNTLVIFTSDNGGEKYSDMGIYKGKKMTLWEGGIREPAIVRWPAKIKPGTTNQVASTMDWTATILAAAKAGANAAYPLDGKDLLPIMTGVRKEMPRTLYWRTFQRMQHKAMRDGKWKYMQDEKGVEYLFDLEADPSEQNNIREQQPELFEKMKEKYARWERKMLKPVPL